MAYCDIEKLTANERTKVWWDKNDAKKGGQRWKTLRHNGVLFPEPYKPLPDKVKIKYKGKPLKLDSVDTKNPFNISAEEGAVFYATKLEQDDRLAEKDKKRKKAKDDPKFVQNFWNDWKVILGKDSPIKDIKDVDFSAVQKYIAERSERKKAERKAMTKEEKKEEKEKKLATQELYGFAVIDGVKIPLAGNVVQPPGLFLGHGTTPNRGKIKKRIMPSDVVINVSKDSIPKCYIHGKPCKWKDVVEKKDVTWIATYTNPVTNEPTYVWLKRAESHFVCSADQEKFGKARSLGENISSIRKKYTKDLSSSDDTVMQMATAVYLLDQLAIRPGTDKDESKEANTLGLTTLRCDNITFHGGKSITIDFTGKSSIQFTRKFTVSDIVYKNLQKLCQAKSKKKEIFPLVTATSLNKYLKTLLPGLTAKVFRTWRASSILQEELDKNIPDPTIPTHEKKLMFDKANIQVSLLLNHKKLGGDPTRAERIKQKISEFEEKLKKANTEKQKASAKKGIEVNKAKLDEVEQNVAVSTAKVNYISPQIVVSWAKKSEMPIEKIYDKTSLKKFSWSMDTDPQWKF